MDNDTKVIYVTNREACSVHGVARGVPCWSFPARNDGLPLRLGICMSRAFKSGILTPEAKRQFLGIKQAA